MEIKQLEPKEKVVTFFGEIKSATVETTIKEIVKINLTDRVYIQECAKWAVDNKLPPMAVTLSPIQLYLSTYGGDATMDSLYMTLLRPRILPLRLSAWVK